MEYTQNYQLDKSNSPNSGFGTVTLSSDENQVPYISVIVPVYNAEKTIERCIGSIVCRKCRIEIICIDDGSNDNSLNILRNLSKTDHRIIVIHQENAGAGEARNNGLRNAKGNYVMFCDADDMYMSDTIDKIVNDITQYCPDYIVFHRKSILLNGGIYYWGGCSENVQVLTHTFHDYLNNFMIRREHGMGVTTKVYKRHIIVKNKIQFAAFRFGEDLWFNLIYIINCQSFLEDFGAYYQQYQTGGSICMQSYSNYFLLNCECIKHFIKQYPREAAMIKPFIGNFLYTIVKRSIERLLLGIDVAAENQVKGKVLEILHTPSIKDYLKYYTPISTRDKVGYYSIIYEIIPLYKINYITLPRLKRKCVKIRDKFKWKKS